METRPFVIFAAFRTDHHLFVKGRLLRNRWFQSNERDGYLRSLLKTMVRALSREMKHHPVRTTYGNYEKEWLTDEEGYFEWKASLQKEESTFLEIDCYTEIKGREFHEKFPVTYYSQRRGGGIISDIDDTLLQTGVTSFFKLRLIFNTLFINPFRRKPIINAAQYFNKIVADQSGKGVVVYISNSPWNIHDYLKAFLNHHNFPKGEIQLRDFGWHMFKRKPILRSQSKYLTIEKVLQLFEMTTFTLIGDSAEMDFEIYSAIDKAFPGRIQEIVILLVPKSNRNAYLRETVQADTLSKVRLLDSY